MYTIDRYKYLFTLLYYQAASASTAVCCSVKVKCKTRTIIILL